jgi:2-polyprenyl-6-methoxyphenol hydroxylase-like FAD-dependent oxidoreductase
MIACHEVCFGPNEHQVCPSRQAIDASEPPIPARRGCESCMPYAVLRRCRRTLALENRTSRPSSAYHHPNTQQIRDVWMATKRRVSHISRCRYNVLDVSSPPSSSTQPSFHNHGSFSEVFPRQYVDMPLNILIVGAGVAGPTLALLLQRACPAHSITIIERAPVLRASGLQLDLKAQGMPIMRKMGLIDAMRAHRVDETGAEIVGAKGESLAKFGVKSGGGTEGVKSGGLTNELEVMRGDMVRVIVDASMAERKKLEKTGMQQGGLKYGFGTSVRGLAQRGGGGVDVTFEDGREERFDLVVGADGQNSRTRKMAFGEEVSHEAFKELGSQVAYFNVPSSEGDGTLARMFFAARSRAIMVRNGGRPQTQIYMFSQDNMDKIKKSYGTSVTEQKAVWTETFNGAGWQTDRFLEGMQTANDFYAHQLAQVKLPALYAGRVVLIGDAGYCPSVITGKGTTSAFIGAYVLAGELARQTSSVDAALKSYNEVMKEPVELAQVIASNMTLPSSSLAVWVIRNGLWAASSLKIDKLVMKLMPGKKEKTSLEAWTLPEYPELKLAE